MLREIPSRPNTDLIKDKNRLNGFGGCETSKKNAKSKALHVKATCGASIIKIQEYTCPLKSCGAGTTEGSRRGRVGLMELYVASAAVACRAGSIGTQKVPVALVARVVVDG